MFLSLDPAEDVVQVRHIMSSSTRRCSPSGSDTGYLSVCIGGCLERACCAAAAAWLMLFAPTLAHAAPEPPPYQQADQTLETQKAKTAPLSQDKQSAATDSSSQLPPLPTSFPLLPDIVVQAPQEVSSEQACLLAAGPSLLQRYCFPWICWISSCHSHCKHSLPSMQSCPGVPPCIKITL